MHETRFSQQILEAVRKNVPKEMLSRTVTVHVRLSPLSHVSAEHLREAFCGLVKAEAVTTPIKLDIQTLEFDVACTTCAKTVKGSRPVFACSLCGSPAIEVKSIEEFFVESIEVERNVSK